MFQLTKIRKELDFNKEIGGIVNVLKGVASSEFYRLQKTRRRLDEFGDYLREFFQMVNIAEVQHPFLDTASGPRALILITSDTGFLGKLNISVVNSALEQSAESDKLIIVGRQGQRYIGELGRSYASFAGISDDVHYEEAERLGACIVHDFANKAFTRAAIVYPHFVSFSVWEVQTYQLLPCRFLFQEQPLLPEEEEILIVEPSMYRIVEYLVSLWLNYLLYGIFWESKLSEWAARVIHLEGSSNEIERLDKRMRFQYFRLLHEVHDTNIREIFASKLAVQHYARTSLM